MPKTGSLGSGFDHLRGARSGIRTTGSAAPPASAPANTAAPTISGIKTNGQTLTAATGSWSNSPTSYAYQWKRAGTNISGATASTYLLVTGDVGSAITVAVTATNAIGSSSAAVSIATSAIAAVLSISGTPIVTATKTVAYPGFSASGAGGHTAYAYSVQTGTLPAGLTLNTSTGAISGTPTAVGTQTGIVIRVTDADGLTVDLASFQIAVAAWTPLRETGNLPIADYDALPASNTISPAGSYATLVDLSGNGKSYTQATDANKPSTATTGASVPVISFDGANDRLERSPFWYNNSGGYTLAVAIKAAAGTAGDVLWWESNSGNFLPFISIAATGSGGVRVSVRNDAGTFTPNNVTIATGVLDNTPHCLIITDDGAGTITAYVDGVAGTPTTYTRGTTTLNISTMGAFDNVGSPGGWLASSWFHLTIAQGAQGSTWRGKFVDFCQRNYGTP